MTLVLSLRDIKKEFGEKKVLENISFDIRMGERIGLVGLNGAGKSTLANIIMGQLEADRGQILWNKDNIRIGYLKQAEKSGSEADAKLSGGERVKQALARLWAKKPEFLILDEPTNHMDYQGIQQLTRELIKFKGTVLIISHDRYFLDQTVDRIFELESCSLTIYNGNYSYYRDVKKARWESQMNQYLAQEEAKAKLKEDIAQLKGWSRTAHATSRTSGAECGVTMGLKEKNRAKAKKLDRQVKSRLKRLEKIQIEGVERPKEEKKISFALEDAQSRGRRIVEARNLSKGFGSKVLLKDSDFYILRGDRIALFGENGCGKTTLIKMILGLEKADKGEFFVSPSLKVSYLSQSEWELDEQRQVLELFSCNSREETGQVRTLLYNMGFDQEMVLKKVQTLSLGERTRLKLAMLILQQRDVLILDEPMNHLDLHSREKLEEALDDYEGTIIMVSHDRFTVQRICRQLLVFKEGTARRLECTLDEYLVEKPGIEEDKLLLENKIAFVLGELSKCLPGSDDYVVLDRQFNDLILKKKEMGGKY